jgi:hypothetical protein
MSPRILVIDIETAPLEGYVWQLFDQNIGLEQIKTEWSILSYAAKWLGESKMLYEDTGGRGPKKARNDKKLMKPLWNLLNEADIVVAQNGKKFDVKKINARLIEHGFGPYKPIKIVDTMLVARKHFGFTSNRLAWMSEHLTDTPKSEHRKFPGFLLWKACLADDPKAFAEMKHYNCTDVEATEKVYLRQRPWISNHPNVGTYAETIGAVCPKCGCGRLQKRGEEVTMHGRYNRLKCCGCGGWSRTKQNLIEKTQRKRLLVNIA